MATRGAKPKPVKLRLVDGTHNVTRHGKMAKSQEIAESAATSFGKLEKPAYLRGNAATAWKSYISPAGWLDASKEPAAIAFCELWAEFRASPIKFPASKHGQLRAYMAELGLTDERNRGDDGKTKKPADDFFDD
ncbi:hypothetical protein KFK14_11385 [Sphingobium phenoxybenzoativorans]|uniref:Terminase n=1 Tax=Sphingobium phenoxybenzoativorans TaxID=1592790 RepID=A0A975Q3V6_9SPHN|nr:hypothetical protein [Sphingobium phenoxybenzoativorans]QUT07932.1 hypothetical protein KFK14_11385 [Sphingobium phenoxybenzoativorans]